VVSDEREHERHNDTRPPQARLKPYLSRLPTPQYRHAYRRGEAWRQALVGGMMGLTVDRRRVGLVSFVLLSLAIALLFIVFGDVGWKVAGAIAIVGPAYVVLGMARQWRGIARRLKGELVPGSVLVSGFDDGGFWIHQEGTTILSRFPSEAYGIARVLFGYVYLAPIKPDGPKARLVPTQLLPKSRRSAFGEARAA
jgi:hypothetical protein